MRQARKPMPKKPRVPMEPDEIAAARALRAIVPLRSDAYRFLDGMTKIGLREERPGITEGQRRWLNALRRKYRDKIKPLLRVQAYGGR